MKIKYQQPSPNTNEVEEIILTREEAIRIQREYVAKVRPDFTYKSDEEALEDYITVNWAWVVE